MRGGWRIAQEPTGSKIVRKVLKAGTTILIDYSNRARFEFRLCANAALYEVQTARAFSSDRAQMPRCLSFRSLRALSQTVRKSGTV